MTRTSFAIAIAALTLVAVPMTSQAAPIAGVAISHGSLAQTVACHMRRVCSRATGRCTTRNVCNTPSRSNMQHNM